jgi:chemotaxis regulatin CheY-phosphate phosphatase CheZ
MTKRGVDRARTVASALEREARTALRAPWWQPLWWRRLKTRHYRDLSQQIDALSRTADAARENLERNSREKGGPR